MATGTYPSGIGHPYPYPLELSFTRRVTRTRIRVEKCFHTRTQRVCTRCHLYSCPPPLFGDSICHNAEQLATSPRVCILQQWIFSCGGRTCCFGPAAPRWICRAIGDDLEQVVIASLPLRQIFWHKCQPATVIHTQRSTSIQVSPRFPLPFVTDPFKLNRFKCANYHLNG